MPDPYGAIGTTVSMGFPHITFITAVLKFDEKDLFLQVVTINIPRAYT
jgi:hypothetical protein